MPMVAGSEQLIALDLSTSQCDNIRFDTCSLLGDHVGPLTPAVAADLEMATERAYEEGVRAGRPMYSPRSRLPPLPLAPPRLDANLDAQRDLQLVFQDGIRAVREEQDAFLGLFRQLLHSHEQMLQKAMSPAPPEVPKKTGAVEKEGDNWNRLAPAVQPVAIGASKISAPLDDSAAQRSLVNDGINVQLAENSKTREETPLKSMMVAAKPKSILARKVEVHEVEESDYDADADLQKLEHAEGKISRVEQLLSQKTEFTLYERFQKTVISDKFELSFGMVIVLNTIVMATEMQYVGQLAGADMAYPFTPRPPKWLGTMLNVLNEGLLWAFVVELLCKLAAFHFEFFTHQKRWNLLDLFVVATGVIDRFMTIDIGLDPLILRLLRLLKLTRFLKMFKMAGSLQTMTLIFKSVAASRSTLFWSMFLLFMLQCVAGMFVTQLTSSYVADTGNDIMKRTEVFKYYGTFTKTQFTMFEVTHVNFAKAARVLTDHVSPYWAWFFVAYRVSIAFAFVQVVRAIFIQSTMKVANRDRELMLHNKRQAKHEMTAKLRDMFGILAGSDTKLTKVTFLRALKLDSTKVWLTALDIDGSDPAAMWELLDLEGDGYVDIDQFSAAAAKLRGSAQAQDLYVLQSVTERIEAKLDTLLPSEFRGHVNPEQTADMSGWN